MNEREGGRGQPVWGKFERRAKTSGFRCSQKNDVEHIAEERSELEGITTAAAAARVALESEQAVSNGREDSLGIEERA